MGDNKQLTIIQNASKKGIMNQTINKNNGFPERGVGVSYSFFDFLYLQIQIEVNRVIFSADILAVIIADLT